MHLQHAELRRLVEHAAPGDGIELARRALELQRVRAVGALQGTAMRELGKQRERRGEGPPSSTAPLSARPPRLPVPAGSPFLPAGSNFSPSAITNARPAAP